MYKYVEDVLEESEPGYIDYASAAALPSGDDVSDTACDTISIVVVRESQTPGSEPGTEGIPQFYLGPRVSANYYSDTALTYSGEFKYYDVPGWYCDNYPYDGIAVWGAAGYHRDWTARRRNYFIWWFRRLKDPADGVYKWYKWYPTPTASPPKSKIEIWPPTWIEDGPYSPTELGYFLFSSPPWNADGSGAGALPIRIYPTYSEYACKFSFYFHSATVITGNGDSKINDILNSLIIPETVDETIDPPVIDAPVIDNTEFTFTFNWTYSDQCDGFVVTKDDVVLSVVGPSIRTYTYHAATQAELLGEYKATPIVGDKKGEDTPLTYALSLTKTADKTSFAAAGETITFTYTVRNNSEATITGPFVILDDLSSVTSTPPDSLAAGESYTGTATYTTTASDVLRESIINNAIVYGSDGISELATLEIPYSATPLPDPDINFTASGGIGFSGTAPLVLLADPSGIYTLVPNQYHDVLIDRSVSPVSTMSVMIPEPYVKTGYIDADS